MTSDNSFYGRGEILDRRPSSKALVVIVHGSGWRCRRSQSAMRGVAEVAREVFPDSDCFIPRLRLEFWRFRDPTAMARRLSDAVEQIWRGRAAAGDPYQEVVLVGFSFGSVIARRVYCEASGADDSALVQEANRKDWSRAVSRIVLLAGMNRGWTVASPVNRFREGVVRVSTAIAHVMSAVREPTLFAIRRGAPFLTLTRLQWLAVRRPEGPITVQLLGTTDDLVSPADNIDLATGDAFFYLEVPNSGHFDVVDMSRAALDRARAQEDGPRRRTIESRRAGVRAALANTREELEEQGIELADLADAAPLGIDVGDRGTSRRARAAVKHVVFVMHGIRDKGFWTQKVARCVKAAAPADWNVRSWSSTYGYFALLPFLCPWTRRGKVEWFLDQYVSARALYPKARFSFIGHSNGTYLFGSALERCRAVRFQHAVLAGSVLRSNFGWKRLIAQQQIYAVRNYVATADWVVAIFPRIFELVPFQDLGSAGHDGFANEPRDIVKDIEYVRGRHGAALDEARWPEIASFLLHGFDRAPTQVPAAEHRPAPPDQQVAPQANPASRNAFVVALGYFCPLVWVALFIVALAPLAILLQALGLSILPLPSTESWQAVVDSANQLPPWILATAAAGWAWILAIILTKV